MPFRVSFLFGLTTEPVSLTVSSAHSAGWSENIWIQNDPDLTAKITRLAPLRCSMLPIQGSMIGWRTQSYTIVGNKLIPGGSASIRQRFPGNARYQCDVPQMCLSVTLPAQGAPNKAQFKLRGIPDGQVTGGEFNELDAFGQKLIDWKNQLIADSWCMLGRNLTNPSSNVLSIVGNVLTVDVALPGVVANTTYIRLRKVKDVLGRPVVGTFLVTAIAGTSYTLAGWTHPSNVGISGSCRVDSLVVLPIANVQFPTGRITVKKVGRPFESYRGRASRKIRV